jgi:hypothetical protein
MPEYSGEERRNNYCPVHHIKCQEIHDAGEAVKELAKTKLSIKMFQIVISIVLMIGGAYWYKMDKIADKSIQLALEHQSQTANMLNEHVNTSNRILKKMSLDVREMKLNFIPVMSHLNLEYREIPEYYGTEPN